LGRKKVRDLHKFETKKNLPLPIGRRKRGSKEQRKDSGSYDSGERSFHKDNGLK